jgi:hypothetical protein
MDLGPGLSLSRSTVDLSKKRSHSKKELLSKKWCVWKLKEKDDLSKIPLPRILWQERPAHLLRKLSYAVPAIVLRTSQCRLRPQILLGDTVQ